MENQFKIGCNAFILKDNKFLLGRRQNCYGAGTWGLPGGHLEIGEDLVEAVAREMSEELGIEVSPEDVEFVSLVEGTRGELGHYLQTTFRINRYIGEPSITEPDKCDALELFSLDDLPKNIFPPHRKIIEAFELGKTYHR